jgi:hypothetical protein
MMKPNRGSTRSQHQTIDDAASRLTSVCQLSFEPLECRRVFANLYFFQLPLDLVQPDTVTVNYLPMQVDIRLIGADDMYANHTQGVQAILNRAVADFTLGSHSFQTVSARTGLLIDLNDETIYRVTQGDTDALDAGGQRLTSPMDQETISIVSLAGSKTQQFHITMASVMAQYSPLDTDVELEYLLNEIGRQSSDRDDL